MTLPRNTFIRENTTSPPIEELRDDGWPERHEGLLNAFDDDDADESARDRPHSADDYHGNKPYRIEQRELI